MSLGELVGEARGLGQPIARSVGESQRQRSSERNPVSRRDKDRLHLLAGAQNGAEALARPLALAGKQPRDIALRRAWLSVRAGKPRLRDPDGGRVQPEAQMASEPETARMGIAVTVAEDQVGRRR